MNGQRIRGDLVVIALPGVQRFIAESRSTSDVAAASEIYCALAGHVVKALLEEADGELILPAHDVARPSSAPSGGSRRRWPS